MADSSPLLWPPFLLHHHLHPPQRSHALASRAAERAPSHRCLSPPLAKRGQCMYQVICTEARNPKEGNVVESTC